MISATKKAKSQALDAYDKNGLQHIGPDDQDLMLIDLKTDAGVIANSATAMGLGSAAVGSGTTANLSRKKATPPQPVKKLVIKPFKGA